MSETEKENEKELDNILNSPILLEIIKLLNEQKSKQRSEIVAELGELLDDEDSTIKKNAHTLLISLLSNDIAKLTAVDDFQSTLEKFLKFQMMKRLLPNAPIIDVEENKKKAVEELYSTSPSNADQLVKEKPKPKEETGIEVILSYGNSMRYQFGNAMSILRRQKESIRLQDVGLMSGTYKHLTDEDIRAVEDASRRYVAAQAILDNVATHESSLVIRDMFPDKDFLDIRDRSIDIRSWKVNVGPIEDDTAAEFNKKIVFKTGKNCDNERKVYIIYGFQLLGKENTTNSIVIKRANVKIIDIIQTYDLQKKGDKVILLTPVLYQARDNAQIEFVFNNGSNGQVEIRPLGFIAESVGQSMVG